MTILEETQRQERLWQIGIFKKCPSFGRIPRTQQGLQNRLIKGSSMKLYKHPDRTESILQIGRSASEHRGQLQIGSQPSPPTNTGGARHTAGNMHAVKTLLLQVLAGTFSEMKAEIPGEYVGKENILTYLLSFSWVLDAMIRDIRANCDYEL